jgi:hypothetical protein
VFECVWWNVFWDGTPRHIFKDSKSLWVRVVTHSGKQLHRFLRDENNFWYILMQDVFVISFIWDYNIFIFLELHMQWKRLSLKYTGFSWMTEGRTVAGHVCKSLYTAEQGYLFVLFVQRSTYLFVMFVQCNCSAAWASFCEQCISVVRW